jgi:hypothetical protein
MAVLPPEATFEEFCRDTLSLRGPLSSEELVKRWDFRCKVKSISINAKEGYRSTLPPEERDLTMKQRGDKIVAEAKAQGRNIAPVGKGGY